MDFYFNRSLPPEGVSILIEQDKSLPYGVLVTTCCSWFLKALCSPAELLLLSASLYLTLLLYKPMARETTLRCLPVAPRLLFQTTCE